MRTRHGETNLLERKTLWNHCVVANQAVAFLRFTSPSPSHTLRSGCAQRAAAGHFRFVIAFEKRETVSNGIDSLLKTSKARW